MRFVVAGDLADAWQYCCGLGGHPDQLAIVIEIPITDRAGIAIIRARRKRREVRKTQS